MLSPFYNLCVYIAWPIHVLSLTLYIIKHVLTHTRARTHTHTYTHSHTAPPIDTDDIVPAIVPQTPPVDPETGSDGTTDNSAQITFTLPANVERNGALDRYVGSKLRGSYTWLAQNLRGKGYISLEPSLSRPSYHYEKNTAMGKTG